MPKSKIQKTRSAAKPDPVIETAPVQAKAQTPSNQQQPRPGLKQALLMDRLSRAEGATLQELIEATGWLSHTARAALTGLRKRGFAIQRAAAAEGPSVYCIATAEPEPAPKPKRRSGGRRKAQPAEARAAA